MRRRTPLSVDLGCAVDGMNTSGGAFFLYPLESGLVPFVLSEVPDKILKVSNRDNTRRKDDPLDISAAGWSA
jgi:hypothetical protein